MERINSTFTDVFNLFIWLRNRLKTSAAPDLPKVTSSYIDRVVSLQLCRFRWKLCMGRMDPGLDCVSSSMKQLHQVMKSKCRCNGNIDEGLSQ